MKTFLYCALLLVVVGIAGFLYRAVLERQAVAVHPSACTLEAKICPDGTTVGRTGPDCAFAACPPDNIELTDANIAFALPDGYVAASGSSDASIIGDYVNQGASSTPAGTIIVRDFSIPSGGSASAVMEAAAVHDPSGLPTTSMNSFTPKVIANRTFQSIVLGNFEGTVESAYFLARSQDVLEFEIIENNVADWTDPSLNADQLPEHQNLLKMLTTLQVTDPALQPQTASTTTTGA